MLSFGHLSVDLSQGTVPALLPFLVAERGYSYAAAGALLLFSSIGSSFLQPLLGAFADRISASWMMPVGTLLAAGGVALSGQFDDYFATGGVLVVSSIGVAMYHPEAVRFASYVSLAGGRQGTGMSMFAVGGLSGWALGPILTTPVVASAACTARHRGARAARRDGATARQHALPRGLPADASSRSTWRARPWPRATGRGFTVAAAAGTLRTGALFGFQAFVPLYVWRTLDSSEGVGNIAIAAMLAARRARHAGRRPARPTSTASAAWSCLALRLGAARAARPRRAAARALPRARAVRA